MKHSVEVLMKVLAKLTNWGTQSLKVDIGYKEARIYDGFGESHIDPNEWGFVVSTTICGDSGHQVSGQGKRIEDALFELCKEVVSTLNGFASHYADRSREAKNDFEKLLLQDQSSKSGPYR